MQKTVLRTFAGGIGTGAYLVASASALHLQVGNILVDTNGRFSPTTLPKHELAPIKLHGYGKISTADNGLPPILDQIIIWFDKNGEVVTKGLPVARRRNWRRPRPRRRASSAPARSSAPASARPWSTSPNRARSRPARRSRSSTAPFKTVADIPKIAGGYGTPIYGSLKIGREWTYKGQRLSYANASCPDGRLQAKGQFSFEDGAVLQGDLLKPCKGKS
jgi:hypothetical protein